MESTPNPRNLLDSVDPEIEHLVQEALQSQGDLREYSRNIEKELTEAENESIKDYIRESGNIAVLHNQIDECDGILEEMEKMLLGFQGELGSLSKEIESLQRNSASMSVQLVNRQAVRGELSQFVDDISLPEHLIKTITKSPVTDPEFIEQLRILGHKSIFVAHSLDTRAAKDVQEVIKNLTISGMTKVREYILTQIKSFKKPSNYQIPQNGLLKNKFFYEFLLQHEPKIAHEIKENYVDTMSKVLFSYFKDYIKNLRKLQSNDIPNKDHVLAAPEEIRGKKPLFSLGKRGDFLQNLEAPAIVPHCKEGPEELSFEEVFRSIMYVLVDNGCREYLFLGEFFLKKGQKLQDLFHSVMGRSLAYILSIIEGSVSSSYDSIGLLLSMHIILRLQVVAHKRAVPALDQFFETALQHIMPYFKKSIELNAYSLKNSTIEPADVRAHYITRRYAELSSGLSVIDAGFPQEDVFLLIRWLQDEMTFCLSRMAGAFQERSKQLVFLINNYDHIITVLRRNGLEPKETDGFRKGLASATAEYAEETLSPHYGILIQFVKEAERLIAQGDLKSLQNEEARVISIISGFHANWKSGLVAVNSVIMSSFPSFSTGAGVIQQGLTLLVQYYHRFQKILNDALPNLSSRQDLVNIHQLMVEVKKYKPNY